MSDKLKAAIAEADRIANKLTDGGPAFACSVYEPRTPESPSGIVHYQGMSLRDYFAAHALQGMFCNGFQPYHLIENHSNPADFNYFRAAYQAADAMIRQREQKP